MVGLGLALLSIAHRITKYAAVSRVEAGVQDGGHGQVDRCQHHGGCAWAKTGPQQQPAQGLDGEEGRRPAQAVQQEGGFVAPASHHGKEQGLLDRDGMPAYQSRSVPEQGGQAQVQHEEQNNRLAKGRHDFLWSGIAIVHQLR